MTARRDPDQLIHAFLMEGQTELADPVYDVVRATIERKRQRVVIGPWRTPDIMNKFVPIGLGAAAMVVALVIGTQVLGPPAPGGVGGPASPSPSPTATPTAAPSVASPSSAVVGGLPEGPVIMSTADDPVQTTVDVATSGWYALPDFDALTKSDDSQDPPISVGGALIAWAWPAGTGFHVYGDPCRWLTTVPETPATTPDEIATAFVTQAQSDATAPLDVTVGGYAGKTVTLQVPMSYEVPGATREEEFGDCDEDMFVFYGVEAGDDTEPYRNAQGPGQIDELWILDVGGSIVIIDAAYGPATPVELVEELRALAESATFE